MGWRAGSAFRMCACGLLLALSPFASAADTAIAFTVSGNVLAAEKLHDGDAATAARAESSPVKLFLLLPDEVVLQGVELRGEGRIRRVSIRLSKDAVTWSDPDAKIAIEGPASTARVTFAPDAARAAMVTIEYDGADFAVDELALVPAEAGRAEAYAVEVAAIGEHAATVRWKTTRPVKTSMLYGFSADRMKSLVPPAYELVTDHEARLDDLLPGTDYFAWIQFDDFASGDSKPLRFHTRGSPYPFAWNPRFTLGRDTALFHFATNVPCDARIEWREAGASAFAATLARENRSPTDFIAQLDGLLPRTAYEYQIVTTDSAKHATATPWFRFTTEANNVALGARAAGTFTELIDEQQVESAKPALERLTDGRNDYFTGMATSGDPTDTDQWALVDLGAPRSLTSIETVWRGNAYPQNYYVMVSADSVHWSYPGFNIDAGAGADERSTRGDPLKRVAVAIDVGTPVRFIMIFMPKGSAYFTRSPSWRFVQLAEVEAHEAWTDSSPRLAAGSGANTHQEQGR